jgi:ankyrin repeat protein
VKLLLASKANPLAAAFAGIDSESTPILTPIHLALSYQLPEIVKLLWDAAFREQMSPASQMYRNVALGRFPIACPLSFRSNAERFAMHGSSHRQSLREVIQLLPVEALAQSSPEGRNALTQAIDLEDVEAVELILEHHPDLVFKRITQPGISSLFTYALNFAVQVGSLRETDESIHILKSILKLDPAAINKADSSSAKPIPAAAMGTSPHSEIPS